MNRELAEHISLMAAPLFAAFAAQERVEAATGQVPPDRLALWRRISIEQAHALWLETLDYSAA